MEIADDAPVRPRPTTIARPTMPHIYADSIEAKLFDANELRSKGTRVDKGSAPGGRF